MTSTLTDICGTKSTGSLKIFISSIWGLFDTVYYYKKNTFPISIMCLTALGSRGLNSYGPILTMFRPAMAYLKGYIRANVYPNIIISA